MQVVLLLACAGLAGELFRGIAGIRSAGVSDGIEEFRGAGSKKEPRIHISWQRRIREGDAAQRMSAAALAKGMDEDFSVVIKFMHELVGVSDHGVEVGASDSYSE